MSEVNDEYNDYDYGEENEVGVEEVNEIPPKVDF